MAKIYKYELSNLLGDVRDRVEIQMPAGATVLHVNKQGTTLCLWAMVPDDAPMVKRTFLIKGTGHQFILSDGLAYIGTVHFRNDRLVLHVFESR